LAGATVRALARSRGVLTEPSFTGLAIVGHRSLREIATLVCLHPHTTGTRDRECGEQQATKKHDAVEDIT
jgi:hypothetical protein